MTLKWLKDAVIQIVNDVELGSPRTKSLRLRKVETDAKKSDIFKNLE
jgi:hypothetical protein